MTAATYPKVYLYRGIVQAKPFIDNNYADHIADEAFFSKFHFIRLFKKIYSKTPHQYLITVRSEKGNATSKGKFPCIRNMLEGWF